MNFLSFRGLAASFLIALGGSAAGAGESSSCQVTAVHQEGSQLRLLVETAQHLSPYYAHGTHTFNVRRYLITAEVGRLGVLWKQAQVFGPLSEPVALQWTDRIDKPDGTTPKLFFNEQGQLVRLTSGEGSSTETLQIEGCGGVWKPAGTASAPNILPQTNCFSPALAVKSLFRQKGGIYEPVRSLPVR